MMVMGRRLSWMFGILGGGEGHLDSTFRGWSATLAARVRLVIARLVLIFALPLDFHGRLRFIRTMLFLEHCMRLRPLSLPIPVCVSYVLLSLRPFGLVGSLLPMLVRFSACCFLCCLVQVFACFAGTWRTVLERSLGCTGCSEVLLMDVLVMVLLIYLLRVLLRLAFSGIHVSLGGSGLDCPC